jgi:VWFA-related protein
MRDALIFILLNALTAALLQQAQSSKPEPLPTFRTGVDIVELDVTVLDKDRHPVKGLMAEDFTILDRGQPQPIIAFSAVEVPAPVTYSAPWMREAPLDVVSNVENRRLVTIVMDDAYTDFDPDKTKRAKQIARNAVDELGPADLASVIFTFMGRAQNFTTDRSRLTAAIDSYVPKRRNGEPPLPCWGPRQPLRGGPGRNTGWGTRKCDIEALAAVAETLSTASPGRKVVIFISGGRTFSFGGLNGMESDVPDLTKLFRDCQRANITVYAFDARGLVAPGGSADRNELPDPGSTLSDNESLYTFAANTGGRTIANTNEPQASVSDVFRESSSYYFIGFRATSDSHDNGLRKVEVKVNRPGVRAQARRGYYPPGNKTVAREVINGLPSGELPVHATAVVVDVPGRREAEVIVAARIDPPRQSTTERTIELSTTAVDLEAKPKGTQRQRITIAPAAPSDRWPDLPAHLRLPPGRYMIQVSATSEDQRGGVVVDVDVPNVSKEALSASALILQRRPPPAIEDKTLAALLPFLPTAERQFRPSDDVGVFLRIYRGGKDRIVPVRMSARVKNEENRVATTYESTLEVANFSEARSADYEVSLPLAQLAPGEYLLEIDAQSGARQVIRTARFSVVK